MILNIDTSTETASICLSKDGKCLLLFQNQEQKVHAVWLHVAIEQMMRDTGYKMQDLQAIAIANGPGSYTGLRVAMATAKGLCYALNIPLITENTLKLMAFAATQQITDPVTLLCPMIDARRMEVFTALYKNDMTELSPPVAMILDEHSFEDILIKDNILFFGSGSKKWEQLVISDRALFAETLFHAGHLAILTYRKFVQQQFTDIIYSEPAYTKDFHTHTKK